jgi:cytoskeletal protein RodZ
MVQDVEKAKLCPHCANSIALDAVKCPYCRAKLNPGSPPEWAERSAEQVDASPVGRREARPINTNLVAVATIVVLAVAGLLLFSYWPRNERPVGSADSSAELREKEQKIQTLEAELAKLRENNQGSSSTLDGLQAKLNESQKDLAETERKLADANREIERLQVNRAAPAPRPSPRPAEPPPPATPRRAVGLYETVRATTVFEEPNASSRVLTQVSRGTRVNVVGGSGEWLEVRSKHGNPPGFIRTDDAMLVGRAN